MLLLDFKPKNVSKTNQKSVVSAKYIKNSIYSLNECYWIKDQYRLIIVWQELRQIREITITSILIDRTNKLIFRSLSA